MNTIARSCQKHKFLALLMALLLVSCKTVYEEIPPEFPDLDEIVPLDTIDFDLELLDLDSNSVSFSQFQDKVIFLNIWGTWCGPCRAEMPGIQRLYNLMRTEQVNFLLISDEPLDTIKKYIDANNYSLPVFKYNKPLPGLIHTKSFPTTFIINQRGEILFRYNLSAKWDHESTIEFLKYAAAN